MIFFHRPDMWKCPDLVRKSSELSYGLGPANELYSSSHSFLWYSKSSGHSVLATSSSKSDAIRLRNLFSGLSDPSLANFPSQGSLKQNALPGPFHSTTKFLVQSKSIKSLPISSLKQSPGIPAFDFSGQGMRLFRIPCSERASPHLR